jgi:beta-lactamase superfamily II metal-dependent hydrolase
MSDGTVRIAFLDVGQGDTIVVSLPEQREAVVVDCIAADTLLEYLKHQSISTVRALILTHLHADHYRQATAFLDNCERRIGARCERLILNPLPEEELPLERLSDDHSDTNISPVVRRTLYQQLESWMLRNPLLVDSPHASVQLPIDGPLKSRIQFLHPFPAFLPRARAEGFNNSSIVLRVNAAGASAALLTGDIEPDGWRLLKLNPATVHLVKGNVLKFPHHGAWKNPNGRPANAHTFLEEVGAKIAIMSVGTEQKGYNHPDAHVFNAIRTRNIHLLCTEATTKCGGAGVLKSRLKTLPILEAHAQSCGHSAFLPSQGCPCAGSIVIDLDAGIRVLQPDESKHKDEIVGKVFSQGHKCPI